MRREPLETVRWLRKRAVDEARQNLSKSIAATAVAAADVRNEESSIQREYQRATDLAGDDRVVETFAAWLLTAKECLARAQACQERHEADTVRRRAELSASQAGLEAIDALVEQRKATVADKLEQKSAQALDEMAARAAAARI